MTIENSTTETANSLGAAARFGWGALIVVTLAVCYFSNLGAIGFVGPDEPRYAWIARDMAETGDWVTPRLYGKPWFEKPVLYYWMAGASFKLFGVSEVTARLPSALCALFATLALAWLAWRVYGGETARWLFLLLPTSVGMIGFSHAAATDMPFSAMVTIAMVCAAVVLGLAKNNQTPILPPTPWIALLLFGFLLGLAVLAKGPAGIILCGGAVFFWAIFTKRWRDAFRLLHPAAIAAFCATALPWYILCARRNPDFFRVFIIEHNFKRYLTPEFQHIQPFWYYVPVLFLEFLPWSLLGIGMLVGRLADKSRPRHNERNLFLISWTLFCFAFFSVSKSKLPGYILPALPAFVLLVAEGMTSTRKILSKMSVIGALTGGAMFFGIGLLPVLIPNRNNSFYILPLVGFFFSAFGIANLVAAVSLRWRTSSPGFPVAPLLATAPILLLFGFVSRAVVYRWSPTLSARAVASTLTRQQIPSQKLRVFRLKRDTQYALNFYLHSEVLDWDNSPIDDGFVLTETRYCNQLKTSSSCEDVWGRLDFDVTTWALLRLTPSTDRSASCGQMQQEK